MVLLWQRHSAVFCGEQWLIPLIDSAEGASRHVINVFFLLATYFKYVVCVDEG